jgi:hypothetical protein
MKNKNSQLSQDEKSLIIFGAGIGISKVLSKIYKDNLYVVKAVVPRCDRKTGGGGDFKILKIYTILQKNTTFPYSFQKI